MCVWKCAIADPPGAGGYTAILAASISTANRWGGEEVRRKAHLQSTQAPMLGRGCKISAVLVVMLLVVCYTAESTSQCAQPLTLEIQAE